MRRHSTRTALASLPCTARSWAEHLGELRVELAVDHGLRPQLATKPFLAHVPSSAGVRPGPGDGRCWRTGGRWPPPGAARGRGPHRRPGGSRDGGDRGPAPGLRSRAGPRDRPSSPDRRRGCARPARRRTRRSPARRPPTPRSSRARRSRRRARAAARPGCRPGGAARGAAGGRRGRGRAARATVGPQLAEVVDLDPVPAKLVGQPVHDVEALLGPAHADEAEAQRLVEDRGRVERRPRPVEVDDRAVRDDVDRWAGRCRRRGGSSRPRSGWRTPSGRPRRGARRPSPGTRRGTATGSGRGSRGGSRRTGRGPRGSRTAAGSGTGASGSGRRGRGPAPSRPPIPSKSASTASGASEWPMRFWMWTASKRSMSSTAAQRLARPRRRRSFGHPPGAPGNEQLVLDGRRHRR